MLLSELRTQLGREAQRTVDPADMDAAINAALDRCSSIRLPCFNVRGTLTFTAGFAPLPVGFKSWGRITQPSSGQAMLVLTPNVVAAALTGAPRYYATQGASVALYPMPADGSVYQASWYAAPSLAGCGPALEQWPQLVALAAGCYLFRLYRNDDEYSRRELQLMGADGSGLNAGCEWFRARKAANTLEMGG
jgi:hypothetical protein